jgi:hypothetical protein
MSGAVNVRNRIARIQSEMQYVQPDTVAWDLLDIEQHMLENLIQQRQTHISQEFLRAHQRMLRNPVQRMAYLGQVQVNMLETMDERIASGNFGIGGTEEMYIEVMDRHRTLVYEQQERARTEAGILLPF